MGIEECLKKGKHTKLCKKGEHSLVVENGQGPICVYCGREVDIKRYQRVSTIDYPLLYKPKLEYALYRNDPNRDQRKKNGKP